MERAFKGVWIPADIWMDKELTWPEKLYMAEIDSLDKGDGCYASSQYLGNFFNHTRQRASQVINSLHEKKRIVIFQAERNGSEKRHMKVIDTRMKKLSEEEVSNIFDKTANIFDENVKYICTENTIDITKDISFEAAEKDMKKSIRSLFFFLYRLKAKERTGTDKREDGKYFAPPWGGKEGSLFKTDYEAHGPMELKRLMYLFFADSSQPVKEFTKSAGYSYPVFHSQIAKLQMCSMKPKKPCEECGSWGIHYEGCPVPGVIAKKHEISHEEVLKAREQFKGVDIMSEVLKKRKEKNNGT